MNKCYVLLLILLYSCGEDKNIDENKIGPIIIQVPEVVHYRPLHIEKIIPLETRDESVFGQFYKLEIFDNDIYVLDRIFTRNLYHFDIRGEYKNKLQTGKGPGEILHSYSMYFDEETKEMYVYDAGNNRISVVGSDLNYLRTVPINNSIAFHHFNRLPGNKWIVQAKYKNHPVNDTTALYVLLGKDFQRIENKYVPYSLSFENVSMLDPVSSKADGKVLFAGIFDNKLYTIDSEEKLQVKYQIDFGKYNLTEEELNTDDRTFITELWQNGKRKTYLDHVHESEDYIGFTYWFVDKMEFCIYSKNRKSILCSQYIDGKDFIMGTLVDLSDEYFVLAVEPISVIEFLSHDSNEMYNSLEIKESDNPILVYYRLEDVL